jgi:hypothetical protein
MGAPHKLANDVTLALSRVVCAAVKDLTGAFKGGDEPRIRMTITMSPKYDSSPGSSCTFCKVAKAPNPRFVE